MEDPELQRRGRWGSVYLDRIGAMAAEQRLPESLQWRVVETLRNFFSEFPEVAEGLRPGEAPPSLMPEENLRRRGPVPMFAPRVDAKAKKVGVGSRLFEY